MLTKLKETLKRVGGFETIEVTEGAQLRLLGRVQPKDSERWVGLVKHFLLGGEVATWKLDISRSYFLRNGDLFYAWRLIFQVDPTKDHDKASGFSDIKNHYGAISQFALNAVAQQPTPEEVLVDLHAGFDRNNTTTHNGKGVRTVDTPVEATIFKARMVASGG